MFIKWRSPKLVKDSVEEMEQELVALFQKFRNHLYQLDDSLIIIPWREFSNSLPANKETELKDRPSMEQYVDKVFFRTNFSTWCRLQIAFNKSPDDILFDDWFHSNSMYVGKESIQEKIFPVLHGS